MNNIFILKAELVANCDKCGAIMFGDLDQTKDYHCLLKCIGCSNTELYELITNNNKLEFTKLNENES